MIFTIDFRNFSYIIEIHTIAVCLFKKENNMKWSTPQASNMRFGFEITMYIANR